MNQINNLYRFSPIKNKEELFDAIKYIHLSCNELCKQSVGEYLPSTGMIGIFCHYESEYQNLIKIQEQLVTKSESINQKYFKLISPITIAKEGGVPKTTYTHLYIRKPDPYRHHVGDTDFYLDDDRYKQIKQSLIDGKIIKGLRIYYKPDIDMLELYNPDIDSLGYIYTRKGHII